VIERACSRGTEAQRQWESCEGHASCVCLYIGVGVVSWTGGRASRCPHDATRGANAPCLRGYARTWAALDSGLHSMLSAATAWPGKAGYSRASSSSSWRSIPGWCSNGDRASSGRANVMSHGTRERCDSSRVRAHRWLR
jgi:hypothetical protein